MATAQSNGRLLGLRAGARVRLDGGVFTVRDASPPEFLIEDDAGRAHLLAVVQGQQPVCAPVTRRPGGGIARSGQWVTVRRYSFVQSAPTPHAASAKRSRPTRRETPAAKGRQPSALREVPRDGNPTSCQALIQQAIAVGLRKKLAKAPFVGTSQPTAQSFFVTLYERRAGGNVAIEGTPGATVEGALQNLVRELERRPAARPPKPETKETATVSPKAAGTKPTITTRKGITYHRNVKDRDSKTHKGHVEVGQHADVKPRDWIRIHGVRSGVSRGHAGPFDFKFYIGSRAHWDAGNSTDSWGTIVAIGKRTVTIRPLVALGEKRLNIYRFVMFNRHSSRDDSVETASKSKAASAPSKTVERSTTTTRKGVTYYRNVKSKDRQRFGVKYPGEVQIGKHADVKPRAWVRIHGSHYEAEGSPSFDLTFRIGDHAIYGSYNLIYTGPITSIGKATVTIKGTSRTKRLSIEEFVTRNHRFDAQEIVERNADTMMRI